MLPPSSQKTNLTTTMSSVVIAIKILNSNSIHFLTLCLFFIPLIFFLTNLQTLNTFKTIITTLIPVIISTVTGVALTTYSTYQALLRKPLTFRTTLKILSYSFTPLLTTFIAGTIEPYFFSLLILGLPCGLFARICLLSFLILYYSVIWGLAPAISVLEIKYGFQPLRVSMELANGYRKMLLYNVLYSGGLIGTVLSHLVMLNTEKSVWRWMLFVQMGVKYAQCSMMFVFYVVMVTVLFLRARAARDVGDVVVKNLMEIYFEDLRVRLVHGGFIYLMLFFIVLFPIISKY